MPGRAPILQNIRRAGQADALLAKIVREAMLNRLSAQLGQADDSPIRSSCPCADFRWLGSAMKAARLFSVALVVSRVWLYRLRVIGETFPRRAWFPQSGCLCRSSHTTRVGVRVRCSRAREHPSGGSHILRMSSHWAKKRSACGRQSRRIGAGRRARCGTQRQQASESPRLNRKQTQQAGPVKGLGTSGRPMHNFCRVLAESRLPEKLCDYIRSSIQNRAALATIGTPRRSRASLGELSGMHVLSRTDGVPPTSRLSSGALSPQSARGVRPRSPTSTTRGSRPSPRRSGRSARTAPRRSASCRTRALLGEASGGQLREVSTEWSPFWAISVNPELALLCVCVESGRGELSTAPAPRPFPTNTKHKRR